MMRGRVWRRASVRLLGVFRSCSPSRSAQEAADQPILTEAVPITLTFLARLFVVGGSALRVLARVTRTGRD